MKLTRRKLLAGLGMLAGGAALSGGLASYAFAIEPAWVRLVRRAMPIPRLPGQWRGRRLVHISDFHIGNHVDTEYLRRTLAEARTLAPDLVVITGDLTDSGVRWLHERVDTVFAAVPRGTHGTFAILGNHDYGRDWRDMHAADKVVRHANIAGFTTLRNEVVDVDGLQLVGFDDFWSPGYDPARAMAHWDATRPGLALVHNPDVCDEPVWDGFRGWILAGHTHGGQVKPPFLPPPLLPVRNKRYTRGGFDLGPGRRLYINTGLGHTRKVRFNVRPEITLFTLEQGTQE